MKKFNRVVVTTNLVSVVLATVFPAIGASSPEEPYQRIAERNAFQLKGPPVDPVPKPKDPPKVFLLGITTIFGNKRAVLKVQSPAKANGPAAEEFLTLVEGQRYGDIEVVLIDEAHHSVKVNNEVTLQELTFDPARR